MGSGSVILEPTLLVPMEPQEYKIFTDILINEQRTLFAQCVITTDGQFCLWNMIPYSQIDFWILNVGSRKRFPKSEYEDMPIGENIKNIIHERRLSLKEVAHGSGIPISTLSQWCNNRQAPLAEPLMRLAKFFSVSVEQLITGQTPEAAVINEMAETFDKHFIQIHQGVYRVKIEKQVNARTTKKR